MRTASQRWLSTLRQRLMTEQCCVGTASGRRRFQPSYRCCSNCCSSKWTCYKYTGFVILRCTNDTFVRTEQNRFGRKTYEIAKCGILDGKNRENGQLSESKNICQSAGIFISNFLNRPTSKSNCQKIALTPEL